VECGAGRAAWATPGAGPASSGSQGFVRGELVAAELVRLACWRCVCTSVVSAPLSRPISQVRRHCPRAAGSSRRRVPAEGPSVWGASGYMCRRRSRAVHIEVGNGTARRDRGGLCGGNVTSRPHGTRNGHPRLRCTGALAPAARAPARRCCVPADGPPSSAGADAAHGRCGRRRDTGVRSGRLIGAALRPAASGGWNGGAARGALPLAEAAARACACFTSQGARMRTMLCAI
jgi:hypothetical protein